MKIIAVMSIPVASGGAFNQSLNAIMQASRICRGRFEFEVITHLPDNVQVLERLGLNCVLFKPTFFERVIALINRKSWWKTKRIRNNYISLLERKLIQQGADLVYFLEQFVPYEPLQQLNYIVTVFDLCHRDTPEFPEVRCFGRFKERERYFNNNLAAAFMVITESESLSNLISQRYGIDLERCLAIPMSPSPFLQDDFKVEKDSVMKKYNLKEGYYFYPAQFWSHKNHVRILEALALLRDAGIHHRVVFSGIDKGNRSHIENLVERYSLHQQVTFLGFVSSEHMRGLYEGCLAVVMPTYFGPTNLPPLEAWTIGKPLVYSAHLKGHAGEAAIYANPDSARELADAMQACTDPDIAFRLVEHGAQKLTQIAQQRKASEVELAKRLEQFECRRKCWA